MNNKIERRKKGRREKDCHCNTCNDLIRISVEITKEVSNAIKDIVKENGVNVDDVVEDALMRHPLVCERMIFLKNQNKGSEGNG